MNKPLIVTGLDIGTSSIKILIAQKKSKDEELEVLGKVQKNALGVRKGVVVNVEEVSELIYSSLKEAEEISGEKIKGVCANIGGSHLFCTSSRGLVSVSRADQKISPEDIDRVIQAAQALSLPSNKEILEVFPKDFIVDSGERVKDALGMQGVRLETEVLILGGFSPYLKNLTQAILNSGFQINDLISTPLSSSRAVLTSREKELGVALLDIGAGTTSLAVFEEGKPMHVAIFPFGSANITNDIAIGLKTDIDTAERIKLEFGSCIFKSRKKEKIKKTEVEEPLVFSQKSLVNIIEARVSEIFDQTNKELKKISRQGLLPAGIVLTGGGSKLPKIVELAKKILKLPCRIGKPKGFFPSQEDPALSVVCGLALSATDLEEKSFSSFGLERGIIDKLKKVFRIFIP